MTTNEVITKRGIEEILHFTTNNGALGFLAEKALLPRAMLKQAESLEFILKNNCDVRKDASWTCHSSMSITKINQKFFEFSESRHGKQDDLWWCILGFEPSILTHADVVFVTGNNIWPRSIKRKGADGLEGLFAASVPGTYNNIIFRAASTPDNMPTSVEAEVLYPGALPIKHMTHVYFREQSHADQFQSMASTIPVEIPESIVVVSEERFCR